jgi:predicted N-acetyltransferase YhbS
MKLAYLADHPEFYPLVAQWNWDEWHTLLVERSAADFEAWLRANVRRDAIPTTLLAFEGAAVVGTVSVMDYDLELSNDLSPWLASLYVPPSHRGKGLGRALVQAAIDEAMRLGFRSLYLYTPGQEAFYSTLGWKRVEAIRYRDQPITIMRRSLSA